MPSWITITLADLKDARVSELIVALQTEALGTGQTDPTPRLITMTIDEIRRCIAHAPAGAVDIDTTTIPRGLKELAVQKVVRLMKGRLLQPLSDDEKEAEKLYQKRLEQLTRGEWPVDQPDSPLGTPTVQRGGSVQVVSSSTRTATGSSLAGL